MRVASLKVCQEVGTRGENSTLTLSTHLPFACEVSAPHMVPVKINTPMMLTSLPDDLTTFHVDIASG